MSTKPGELQSELWAGLGEGTVTLVFSSRETELNNAAVLKEFLETRSQDCYGIPGGQVRGKEPQ